MGSDTSTRYLIGGGAILEAGEHSTIKRATLHAQVRAEGPEPKAVLVDFESGSPADLRRLLALVCGNTAERFETTVTPKLLEAGVCGFEDVAAIVAQGAQAQEVHLFARWAPAQACFEALAVRGVALVAHPLTEIARAALIAEHRFAVWSGAPQAA